MTRHEWLLTGDNVDAGGFRLYAAFVTSLPTWAVLALSLGSSALTAAIAFTGQYLGNRAERDLETRSRREEVMRNLRWAAELAVSEDLAKARLGQQQLKALRDAKMLNPTEEVFIDAAEHAVVEVPRQAIARLGEDVELVVTTDPAITGVGPVSPEEREEQEGDEQEGKDILWYRGSS